MYVLLIKDRIQRVMNSVKFRNGRNVNFLFQTIYNIKMTRSRDNSNLKTLLKTQYGTNKKRYQCKCVLYLVFTNVTIIVIDPVY